MQFIKDKLINSFNKLGTYNISIFNKVHQYLADNYFFYYDSLKDYSTRTKPSARRIRYYYMNMVVTILFTIRYGLLSLYDSQKYQILLGEFSFVAITKYRSFNTFAFACGLAVVWPKLVMYYFDINHNNYYYTLMMDITQQKPFYQ